MPPRLRDAVLVLIGIHHDAAVRLLSRLSDWTVELIGQELLMCDIDRIRTDETEAAIRAMLRSLQGDDDASDRSSGGNALALSSPDSNLAQVLTAQECQFLASILIDEKEEICAIILTCLPLPVIVRILFSMRKGLRSSVLRRYRSMNRPPADLRDRVVHDFTQRIPTRPFPALGTRFEAAVAAL